MSDDQDVLPRALTEIEQAPLPTGLRAIPGSIWALGFVSMFADVSSEMIHSLLLVFLVSVLGAAVMAAAPPLFLPDGSLRPGVRITIPAGKERELLFRPEGVRFLSGRADIMSVGDPLVGPDGQEIKEFVIDTDKFPGVAWIHHDKPFRLRISAETDFTLEARESWEWNPEKDLEKRNPL